MKHYQCILVLLVIAGSITSNAAYGQSHKIKEDSLFLFDSARARPVPVALYLPAADKKNHHSPLVIFSHGYNANQPGSNKSYSYITQNLAAHGYFVASIQHELPSDSLLPVNGIPQVVRRSNWERGVENILFVLNALKRLRPGLDYTQVILMGHSNGGDMSMLFASEYPLLVSKVISLDNRRVAFPRTHQPRLYSLRSSDQPADNGVLPGKEEQQAYQVTIIQLANTIHNDMGNGANPRQRREINNYIMEFLKDR